MNEERHLDKYIEELRNEIAEVNGRTGDITQLEGQYNDLSSRYAAA
jgi:uncharacterized protein involved in exopolysaccharide biosynthesis